MSEEIAQAAYDVLYWKQRAEQAEAMARTLAAQLDRAEARARVVAETYNGQQQSYRELEALYQASQTRALAAEAALRQAAGMKTIKGARAIAREVLDGRV